MSVLIAWLSAAASTASAPPLACASEPARSATARRRTADAALRVIPRRWYGRAVASRNTRSGEEPLERPPEDGRVARPPVRVEGVAGDHTDPCPPQSLVEALGVFAGDGVQHEQRLAL